MRRAVFPVLVFQGGRGPANHSWCARSALGAQKSRSRGVSGLKFPAPMDRSTLTPPVGFVNQTVPPAGDGRAGYPHRPSYGGGSGGSVYPGLRLAASAGDHAGARRRLRLFSSTQLWGGCNCCAVPEESWHFQNTNPGGLKTICLPDLSDRDMVDGLARCWQATAEMKVPQYRDGECDVRRIWDDAVADALGWDKDWLSGLRHLLHREPHVRGLGYNQFG